MPSGEKAFLNRLRRPTRRLQTAGRSAGTTSATSPIEPMPPPLFLGTWRASPDENPRGTRWVRPSIIAAHEKAGAVPAGRRRERDFCPARLGSTGLLALAGRARDRHEPAGRL